MRQAIVEEPEWQHFQLLAYSRRADELLRLRDLPETPTRAVVEYAERSQEKAAEAASPAPLPATEPAATNAAGTSNPSSREPAVVASIPGGSPATNTAAPAPAETAAKPDTVAALSAVAPSAIEPPNDPAAVADDARAANVQRGPVVTASINPPDEPFSSQKPHRHGTRLHHRHQVRRPALPNKPQDTNRFFRGPRTIQPTATTSFGLPLQMTNDGRIVTDAAANGRLR